MIRRTLLAAVAAASVSLGGCATTGGGGSPAVDLTSFVAQVQSTTNAVCAFIPTAETIAQILSLGNPLVSTASSMANAICAAVKPATSARLRAAGPPSVLGVPVHGTFTR